jgi:hypothetical protein
MRSSTDGDAETACNRVAQRDLRTSSTSWLSAPPTSGLRPAVGRVALEPGNES